MRSPSRKYVDLILKASSKWANWDPPNQIKVGDYGTVDKETGQFEKEGNIYEDADIAKLVAEHPPHIAAPENSWIVSSSSVKRREITLTPELSVTGLAEATIKGRWEFGTKRGALLIMARPRSCYIPPNVILERLAGIPALKDKSLVTQVISCPAYSLYLSSANNDVIDVALIGSGPLPGAPGVTAGGEISAAWWAQNTTGLFRDACDKDGSENYTPLYTLKKIRKPRLRRRESPVPEPEGDDLWVDTLEPWDPLDEDGEEEEFEDTIFD